ncbi:MAG: hypothetical protein JJ957_01255 [Pseudomonadales bacterium]|nr:hypothetical protein [Pseudomonadales bacterium]MBO6594437.1 hypothetical protein [Pseudomonadales bacterium]MBO6822002.1 hypothetical protein [Pseudomonadales bacterium]
MTESKSLKARVWPLESGIDSREMNAVSERFGPPWIGVCISGGGSRSLSAAMGQLRGLQHLGLMDKVSWLSCVSGGCWASTLYTYLPDNISDETFLGGVADPSSLHWDGKAGDPANLDYMSPNALGSVPQRLGWLELLEKAVEFHEQGVPENRMWAHAIGALVLSHFGLGNHPSKYFSWTSSWLQREILDLNEGLSVDDFVLTREGRPYLVTNATLFYPPDATHGPFRPDPRANPYLIESTPLGVGIAPTFPFAGSPDPGVPGSRDIGGGWVDSFAFGGPAPEKVEGDIVTVPTPATRYRLSDAAGNSSSAFVATILDKFGSQYKWLEDLVPVFDYWPVNDPADKHNSAYPYFFGDGGNFEDTGIAGLIRRKIPRIVSFVNGNTPLGYDDAVQQVSCDSQIAVLFGYAPKETGKPWERFGPSSTSPHRFAQVFEADRFMPLLDDLWKAHTAGASALSVQDALPVVKNARLGIEGGYTTDVLFVVNTPVPAWNEALPEAVKLLMHEPGYTEFPNYDTLEQLHLSERQVNLLAHLSCWNVMGEVKVGDRPANSAVFTDFFAMG